MVLTLFLLVSCNKNDSDNEEAMEEISGHWHVWDFEPNTQSDDATLAKESILQLVEVGCDPIEFTFKKEGYVAYRNGMSYLTASSDETGVSVDCAPSYDSKEGTYDFDYKTLTLNFNSETIELNAALEDEFLTTLVDDIVINGVTVSGKLYFMREIDQ